MAATGIVALWNTCVGAFDLVAYGEHYEMEHQIIHAQLEVERVQLILWGEWVRLSNVGRGHPCPHLVIDSRLNRPEIRGHVMSILRCIENIFDDANALSEKYGLKKEVAGAIDDGSFLGQTEQSSAKVFGRGRQSSLGSIFRRVYSSVKKRSRDRQQTMPLMPETTWGSAWVITDKVKFLRMVAEIRAFNHGLACLFPDLTPKAANRLREEIEASGETRFVQLRMGIEVFTRDESLGALTCGLYVTSWASCRSASVYWEGGEGDFGSLWDEEYRGFVQIPHDALDVYRRKRYLPPFGYGIPDTPTDEDYTFLDAECDPKYDNVNPGTVTTEGYGLECWDYEVRFGKPHKISIAVHTSDLPNISATQLLRRLHKLKTGMGELGLNRTQDYDDLKEFTGTPGITYSEEDPHYENLNQISILYELLNRPDQFVDFAQMSSIALAVHGGGVGLWNFLYQVVLGLELARRLRKFRDDTSMSGFTTQVLSTLIIADIWLHNVDLVLVDLDIPGDEKAEKKESELESEKEKEKEVLNTSDDAFDTKGKDVEMHSLIHQKQVDGLLRFAEMLQWPFMSETRDYAEHVYGNLRNGKTIKHHVWDWVFGTVLPGRWAAFKIMAALVLCTPSLTESPGAPPYLDDNGLSLPKQSYWRSRTVLGRVLGSLPGVKSVCGWIGPCPPIDGPTPSYVSLRARRVAPTKQEPYIGGADLGHDEETIRLTADDDVHQWMADIQDESRWVCPKHPVQRTTACTVESIQVKALPLDESVAAKSSTMSAAELEQAIEYRASIVFKIDDQPSVTYILYANPVFVTAPVCISPPSGHRVHMRELPKFYRNIWNVENLKDISPDEHDSSGVLVINATGKGAETVARAWCSETGKNAIIRRNPGPCFVCAYNMAGRRGLGVNVLIWVT